MQQFIEKFREQIRGVVSGFDRLIFRGSLRRLNYGYWNDSIRAIMAVFKHYADHVEAGQ